MHNALMRIRDQQIEIPKDVVDKIKAQLEQAAADEQKTIDVLARARKPEYPLDFLQSNRAAYLNLSCLAGMTVIGASTIAEVERKITDEMLKRWHDLTLFSRGRRQIDPQA